MGALALERVFAECDTRFVHVYKIWEGYVSQKDIGRGHIGSLWQDVSVGVHVRST